MIELERTYLAKFLPQGIENALHKEIIDIYIPKFSNHSQLRIRKNGEKMEITKKLPVENDPSKQHEFTIPLSKEEFETLNSLEGKKIHKIRYYYDYQGSKAEIDIFQGDLKGLVLVDFEFDNEQTKNQFLKPDFCLEEVTYENFIAGGVLCGKKYQDILPYLEKYNYKQLEILPSL